jgi:hypothetical protein
MIVYFKTLSIIEYSEESWFLYKKLLPNNKKAVKVIVATFNAF